MHCVVDITFLKPNCKCEEHNALSSLIRMTQSRILPKILLKEIALSLLELHNDCFLFLGIGIIVPIIIESGLKPCDKNKVYTVDKIT